MQSKAAIHKEPFLHAIIAIHKEPFLHAIIAIHKEPFLFVAGHDGPDGTIKATTTTGGWPL